MKILALIRSDISSTAFFTSFSVLGSRGPGVGIQARSPVTFFTCFFTVFLDVFVAIPILLHTAYVMSIYEQPITLTFGLFPQPALDAMTQPIERAVAASRYQRHTQILPNSRGNQSASL